MAVHIIDFNGGTPLQSGPAVAPIKGYLSANFPQKINTVDRFRCWPSLGADPQATLNHKRFI